MLRTHLNHVAAALAGHDAEPFHPDQIGPSVLTHIVYNPRRPRHMASIWNVDILDLLERVELGEIKAAL
jgi:hypothetical protein